MTAVRLSGVITKGRICLSGTLLKHLRRNPEVVREHVSSLSSELVDLGHPRPVILALGGDAHR